MQTEQICCASCGSSKHSVCWADMDEVEAPADFAPVFVKKIEKKVKEPVWKQGPPPSLGVGPKPVELVVEPVDVAKKCEAALEDWLKSKKSEDDGWTLASKPKRCQARTSSMIVCQACTMPFEYTQQMKEKYEKLGWVKPKVCKACSQQRFEAKKSGKW